MHTLRTNSGSTQGLQKYKSNYVIRCTQKFDAAITWIKAM